MIRVGIFDVDGTLMDTNYLHVVGMGPCIHGSQESHSPCGNPLSDWKRIWPDACCPPSRGVTSTG